MRPAKDGLRADATGTLPAAEAVASAGLGEATEGRLLVASGTLVGKPSKATSGDISVTLELSGGTRIRAIADGSTGIAASTFVGGARYRLTGIGGQRATRKGALDGYRLWLRDRKDVERTGSAPGATPGGTPKPSEKAAGAAAPVSVQRALGITDRSVTIDAVVTAGAALLDTSGRRVVVQDGTGAVEVLAPTGASAPRVTPR